LHEQDISGLQENLGPVPASRDIDLACGYIWKCPKSGFRLFHPVDTEVFTAYFVTSNDLLTMVGWFLG
jgi:hypothetical protein